MTFILLNLLTSLGISVLVLNILNIRVFFSDSTNQNELNPDKWGKDWLDYKNG
jgi:hypothetical protein